MSRTGRSSPETLPEHVGRYRILQELGRGGMGVVYRAVHEETGDAVALKTVRVPHAGVLQSIRREIHALARIRHPGIVRIVEEGLHAGLPWYAMELLEGHTLRHMWRLSLARTPTVSVPATPSQGEPQVIAGANTRTWWTRQFDQLPLQEAAHDGPPGTIRVEGTAIDSAGRGTRLAPEADATGFQQAHAISLGTFATGAAWPVAPSAAGPTRSLGVPRVVASSRLPAAGGALRAALTLMRRLCAPLAYLHGEGIVHRDLKPENILIRADGFPVLLDFGLVSQFSGALSRDSLAFAGVTGGTVAYMAPEQARGELVDARADLYSLGCILYELVTTNRPFRGATDAEILEQHQKKAPQRPSSLVEGVPPGLDDLLMGLLAKQPEHRPGHADVVAAALQALGAEEGLAVAGPSPRAYLYRAGLVGRGQVMQRLRDALGDLQSSQGSLILLGGESGAGKTRLALELGREAAATGCLVLVGEAEPERGGLLGALRRPLQQIADRCRERGLEETERLLGRRGKLLARFEPSLAGLPGQEAHPDPEPLQGDAARLRVLADLNETLSALALQLPVLLVIDDLHWADELTLGFLDLRARSHQIGAQREVPLLILAAYRSEEVGEPLQQWLASLGALRRLTSLQLARLDESAVAEMVGQMLALSPPPLTFSRYLARHSEGNPLFVAEYLRAAVEERLLWRDSGGRWRVGSAEESTATTGDYEALALPVTLRELVGRRLQGLPPDARKVAEAAAVLGRESFLPLVWQLSDVSDQGILEGLEDLLRRQVLEVPAPAQLRFVHDKIREVTYAAIAVERRRRLHENAARGFDQLDADERDRRLGELAYHWEEAGQDERARATYLAAARHALRQSAFQDVLEHARRAKRLSPPHDVGARVESVESRVLLAEAMVGLGRYDDAIQEASDAATPFESRMLQPEAEPPELRDKRYRAQLLLGRVQHRRGDYASAVRTADVVLDAAPGDLVRFDALEVRGRALSALGQHGAALIDLERARAALAELARHGSPGPALKQLANVTAAISVAHMGRGAHEPAIAACQEALAIQRERGDRQGLATSLGHLAWIRVQDGDLDSALPLLKEVLAIQQDIGDRAGIASTRNHAGVALWESGALDLALQELEAALALRRELGELAEVAATLNNIGYLHMGRGNVGAALQALQEALDLSRASQESRLISFALTNLGLVHLKRGAYEAALQSMEEALAIQRQDGRLRVVGMNLVNIGAVHWECGRYDRAQEMMEEALVIFRDGNSRMEVAICLNKVGLVHASLGSIEAAMQAHAEALSIAREHGYPKVAAEALCSIGTLHAMQGRWSDGERDLNEGIGMFEKVRMSADVALGLAARARLRMDAGLPGARPDAERALAQFRETGNPFAEGATLATLARLDAQAGELDAALDKVRRSRALVPREGTFHYHLQVLEADSAVRLVAGDRSGAKQVAGEGAELARSRGAIPALQRLERILSGLA